MLRRRRRSPPLGLPPSGACSRIFLSEIERPGRVLASSSASRHCEVIVRPSCTGTTLARGLRVVDPQHTTDGASPGLPQRAPAGHQAVATAPQEGQGTWLNPQLIARKPLCRPKGLSGPCGSHTGREHGEATERQRSPSDGAYLRRTHAVLVWRVKPDAGVRVLQATGDDELAPEDGEMALGDTFANEELEADEDPNMYASPAPFSAALSRTYPAAAAHLTRRPCGGVCAG
jgi:hypothetical protein